MGILKKVLERNRSCREFCIRGRSVRGCYSVSQSGHTKSDGIYFHGDDHRRHSRLFRRSSASLEENIGLLVNGVPTGVTGLNNHTSSVGDEVDLGSANAGDILTFLMFIPPASNSTGPYARGRLDPNF